MACTAFEATSLDRLSAAYPLVPQHLAHGIADHPLLTIEAMAELARILPEESIEFNAATNLPLGISNSDTPHTGLNVHETIERIEECGSWVLLKTIDQVPAYNALMREVLAEIEPVILPKTGPMMRLEGFIFISSPGAVTSLHFDPEYNILFQARGSKTMTLFPAADPQLIGDPFFEAYFAGGPRNLPWFPEREGDGQAGCLPLGVRYKRYSRNTRPLWPRPAGRIGNGEQRFPNVGMAIFNARRHLWPTASNPRLNLPRPAIEIISKGLHCWRFNSAPERFNHLVGRSAAHSDHHRSRKDSLRYVPEASNGDGAISWDFFGFDDLALHDTSAGYAVAPMPSVDHAA